MVPSSVQTVVPSFGPSEVPDHVLPMLSNPASTSLFLLESNPQCIVPLAPPGIAAFFSVFQLPLSANPSTAGEIRISVFVFTCVPGACGFSIDPLQLHVPLMSLKASVSAGAGFGGALAAVIVRMGCSFRRGWPGRACHCGRPGEN